MSAKTSEELQRLLEGKTFRTMRGLERKWASGAVGHDLDTVHLTVVKGESNANLIEASPDNANSLQEAGPEPILLRLSWFADIDEREAMLDYSLELVFDRVTMRERGESEWFICLVTHFKSTRFLLGMFLQGDGGRFRRWILTCLPIVYWLIRKL